MFALLANAWNFVVQVTPSVLYFVCGQVDKVADIAKISTGS